MPVFCLKIFQIPSIIKSMALALYRKYRPKKFADLLGQESVVEILKNAARLNRIAHAYLFYGARGTGKTTAARLLAKTANCEKRRGDGEPCNSCRICEEIDAGKALDLVEIDAASNRGIDEIRNIKESVNLTPTSYRYKTFIIDEAHMLTRDAFNALLKTLEEPPPHVIFILATTEYEKLPATIVSRAQKFHFKRLPLKKILEKLSSVAASEKIEAEPRALELIAAAGEGSLRDAESLLDQVSACGDKLTADFIEINLGRIGYAKTTSFAELLFLGKLKESLAKLTEIHDNGYNLTQFNKELIHYLRKVLALKFDPSLESAFQNELTSEELSELKKHAAFIDEKRHIILMKSLIRAYSEMRYSPFAIVPLEIAIIENLS